MGELLDALDPCDSKVTSKLVAQIRARETTLLEYVQTGRASWEWSQLDLEVDGHAIRIWCLRDGVKVEGVRLSMSAHLAQQCADAIGAMLPTPKLCDLIYRAAPVRLSPIPRGDWVTSLSMATTQHMIDQSAAIDARIGEAGGVVADVGKDWVLVNALGAHPGKAANYGWHVDSNPWEQIPSEAAVTFPAQPGAHVLQGVGTRHPPDHADYSQVQRLVSTACEVDGEAWDLRDLAQSATLGSLVASDAPLTVLRQPETPTTPGGAQPGGGSSSSSSSSGGGGGDNPALAFALSMLATLGTVFAFRRWV